MPEMAIEPEEPERLMPAYEIGDEVSGQYAPVAIGVVTSFPLSKETVEVL